MEDSGDIDRKPLTDPPGFSYESFFRGFTAAFLPSSNSSSSNSSRSSNSSKRKKRNKFGGDSFEGRVEDPATQQLREENALLKEEKEFLERELETMRKALKQASPQASQRSDDISSPSKLSVQWDIDKLESAIVPEGTENIMVMEEDSDILSVGLDNETPTRMIPHNITDLTDELTNVLSSDESAKHSSSSSSSENPVHVSQHQIEVEDATMERTATIPAKSASSSSASSSGFQSEKISYSDRWTDMINLFRHGISKGLQTITSCATRYPKRFVLGIFIFSIGILALGFFTNFHLEVNEEDAWTPYGSRSLEHTRWLRQSGFPQDDRFISVLIHANGDNILETHGKEGVEHAFDILEIIKNTPGYNRVCRDYETRPCWTMGVTKFWGDDRDKFLEDVQSETDLQLALSASIFPDGLPVDSRYTFGKSRERNSRKIIVNTNAYLFGIFYEDIEKNEQFELEALNSILKQIEEWKRVEDNTIQVEVLATRSFADEFTRAIFRDLPLIPIVFAVMSIFTCIVFTMRCHPVYSRTLLGFGAVVAVLLSIMSGYGLLFCFGVPFTSMSQILPFIMFGIGLDNAFIIIGAFNRTLVHHSYDNETDTNLAINQRIQEAISEVGNSIFLTTLTSSAAFALGASSTVPSVRTLCIYAFTTILFVFLYQMTFFVALIVLDERRMQQKLRNCFFCLHYYGDEGDNNSSISSHFNDANSEVEKLNPLTNKNEDECEEKTQDYATTKDQYRNDGAKQGVQRKGSQQVSTQEQSDTSEGYGLIDDVMRWYIKRLLKPGVKAAVIILFVELFMYCAYRASNLTQEFSFTDVVPRDSYVTRFVDATTSYSDANAAVPQIYFRYVDQSSEQIQQQMRSYVSEMAALPFIGSEPAYFWLKDFNDFRAEKLISKFVSTPNSDDTDNVTISVPSFNELLDEFLSDRTYYYLYNEDIVRDQVSGDIIASRCWLYFDDLDQEDVEATIHAYKEQHRLTEEQPINQIDNGNQGWPFFSHSDVYNTWKFFSVAVQELIFSTVMGVVAVAFFALVLIPHWTAILFVLPLIIILYVDLMGILEIAGLHVNAVTYVALVMSIGLMVDYIMHVLLRFYECEEGTRGERVYETLRTMGTSVLLGGLSTLLGVIPLAATSSKIIQTIFVAFIALVTLGISHGLVLLPVILSIVGPIKVRRASSTGNSRFGQF